MVEPLRSFTVHVYGFDPHTVQASTASGARYKDYLALRDAGYRWDFHKYLINSRIERCQSTTPAPPARSEDSPARTTTEGDE